MEDIQEMRYERKFVITEFSQKEIESIIKHNPAIFSEMFYERQINNIYLDSIDLKNYKENIEGHPKRMKIRIRWYGKIFGLIQKPILELKIKNNELGKKLSFPLQQFNLNKNFTYKTLKNVFEKSSLPDFLREKLKLYHPTILNSYIRRYFISADKKYRLTLDKDLIFYSLKHNKNTLTEKIHNKEIFILEIKYPSKDYHQVSRITQHFPFRLSTYSKYVSGIDSHKF